MGGEGRYPDDEEGQDVWNHVYPKTEGSVGGKEEEGRASASVFTVYSSGYRRWCWRRRMLMEHGLVVHSEWCLEWG